MDQKNSKERLISLIHGYEGYQDPKTRQKSSDLFEKFIVDKVSLLHNFFLKKYDEFVLNQTFIHLLMPLGATIKLFADCKDKLNYQRSGQKFFFEEYRIDKVQEEKLYDYDFSILKNISLMVDKITTFSISNQEHLLQFNEVVTSFKESVFQRLDMMYFINESLKNVYDELFNYLRLIRDRDANDQTYEGLQNLLKNNPGNILLFKETFNCFRNASTAYIIVRDNFNVAHYKSSVMFLEKYEEFLEQLKNYMLRAELFSPEEEECFNHIKERLPGVIDFAREKKIILSAMKTAEVQAAKRKVFSQVMNKAAILYDAGAVLERDMLFLEAMEFYQAAYKIDPQNQEAAEAFHRCEKKKHIFADFQKANHFFIAGKYDKAREIYQKILSLYPDMEEIKNILDHLVLLEEKNG